MVGKQTNPHSSLGIPSHIDAVIWPLPTLVKPTVVKLAVCVLLCFDLCTYDERVLWLLDFPAVVT